MDATLTGRNASVTTLAVRIGIGLISAALVSLGVTLAGFLVRAGHAIAWPFGIDYGEGIVWQQALLMHPGTMYGDITRQPFIVFHYPPIYHLTVRLVTSVTGADMLAVGRGVSVAATLVIALLVGRLALRNAPAAAGSDARLVAGLVAGLSIFTWWPVMFWAVLMRVDMLGSLCSLAGFSLGIAALARPRLLYAAMALFVAAVFCKQTELTAPIAVMAVHLIRAPGHAVRVLAAGILAGLAGLAVMEWLSGGRFLDHILFYNVNRMALGNAIYALRGEARQAPLVVLALLGFWLVARKGGGWRGLAGRVRADAGVAERTMLCLWPLLLLPTLATLAKSGGSVNYFIPLIIAGAPFVGIAAAWAMTAAPPPAAVAVALLLAVQPWLAHLPGIAVDDGAATTDEQAMEQQFRAAPGPILADDMVLLLRAGKRVELEPSIFAELGATGHWDSTRLIRLLDAHAFALVQTERALGSSLESSRFTRAVAAAIRRDYPRVERIGEAELRRPASD